MEPSSSTAIESWALGFHEAAIEVEPLQVELPPVPTLQPQWADLLPPPPTSPVQSPPQAQPSSPPKQAPPSKDNTPLSSSRGTLPRPSSPPFVLTEDEVEIFEKETPLKKRKSDPSTPQSKTISSKRSNLTSNAKGHNSKGNKKLDNSNPRQRRVKFQSQTPHQVLKPMELLQRQNLNPNQWVTGIKELQQVMLEELRVQATKIDKIEKIASCISIPPSDEPDNATK